MPRAKATSKITAYLPAVLNTQLYDYAAARSISVSHAVQLILEDHFSAAPKREAQERTDVRMVEVNEFLFASISHIMASVIPNGRDAVFNDFNRNMHEQHPQLVKKG